ncbi:MAG: MarC family protein [Chlamydiales bacterium]
MTLSSIVHLTFLFLIILDPLGNVPIFVGVLKHLNHERQRLVIIREMLIALGVMIGFLFLGEAFFHFLHVDEHSLRITGGIILFLIAIPMIFSTPFEAEKRSVSRSEPLIVPLAIPAIAGPAILATITLYGAGVLQNKVTVFIAILIAWLLTLPILLLSPLLKKWMGDNGLTAIERLFGYLVILISAQMILQGLCGAFNISCPPSTKGINHEHPAQASL